MNPNSVRGEYTKVSLVENFVVNGTLAWCRKPVTSQSSAMNRTSVSNSELLLNEEESLLEDTLWHDELLDENDSLLDELRNDELNTLLTDELNTLLNEESKLSPEDPNDSRGLSPASKTNVPMSTVKKSATPSSKFSMRGRSAQGSIMLETLIEDDELTEMDETDDTEEMIGTNPSQKSVKISRM